ncbi:hypothetical protein O1611_g7738 [Lasiodiplodia mahajangana]|uniref:Uncharacterized protein n=1 Tax=Lasiodiplodia mahajangana TaxID=1108764 RepID=A0ACC2JEF3_9PEZI|nr:hypothetical protein O1611_g7738 [Lasiodiplodia mahajangana]
MAAVSRSLDPEGPIVQPPPGVQSNFINPPNGNATMNGITSLPLAPVRRVFEDDPNDLIQDLALPAIAASIVLQIFIYRITSSTGFFVQGWDLQLKDASWHFFNIYIITSMYNVAMIFLKAAILLQWARIFAPTSRNVFWWLCYSVATINAIFYVVTILIDLLYCHPVQYHWNKFIPGGYCVDDNLLSPLSAVINVVLDVTILVIPQRIVWKLNMPFKKKIGISCIFIVGILCIASASARLSFALKLLTNGDYAYDASYEVLLGSLELTFAFLTFSFLGIPKQFILMARSAKSLLRKFYPRSESKAITDQYLVDTDERGLVPIVKAGSSKSGVSDQQHGFSIPMQGLSNEVKDHEILRTTRLNISESYVSDDSSIARDVLLQQHPWDVNLTKPVTS